MDLQVFIDILHKFAIEAKEQNVSITIQIYPDYTEITVEPFQAIKAVRNNGSVSEYVFKEDE